jgi:hypothetical protein
MSASNTPHWNDEYGDQEYAAWDALMLGGYLFPGTCKITGAIGQRLDVTATPGSNGAIAQDQGADPAKLKATLRAYRIEHVREIEGYLEEMHPRLRRDTESIPLDIVHPATASPAIGIRQVRIESVSVPEISDDHWNITLSLLEHFQAPEPQRRTGSSRGNKKGSSLDDLEKLPSATVASQTRRST